MKIHTEKVLEELKERLGIDGVFLSVEDGSWCLDLVDGRFGGCVPISIDWPKTRDQWDAWLNAVESDCQNELEFKIDPTLESR